LYAGVRLEKPVPTIAATLDRDGQHRLTTNCFATLTSLSAHFAMILA
jgi:hypothetical protein